MQPIEDSWTYTEMFGTGMNSKLLGNVGNPIQNQASASRPNVRGKGKQTIAEEAAKEEALRLIRGVTPSPSATPAPVSSGIVLPSTPSMSILNHTY